MAWHLKDRELEKKLEEFTGGEFVKSLKEIENNEIDSEFRVYVHFNRKVFNDDNFENCLCFLTRELEEIHEYNPHAWNEYPKVTPPFDIDMRVELNDGLRYCAHYLKFSDGCFWVGTNGTGFPNYLNDKVVRFRPWEG